MKSVLFTYYLFIIFEKYDRYDPIPEILGTIVIPKSDWQGGSKLRGNPYICRRTKREEEKEE